MTLLMHSQDMLWTPKAKERPRAQPGGKGRSFTPKATRDAEAALAAQYTGPLFDGPVATFVQFYNDHIYLELIESNNYLHRKLRGDTDNYLKLVTDALNGVAYHDDRQIVSVTGRKN